MAGIIFLLPTITLIKAGLYTEVVLIFVYFVIGLIDDIFKITGKKFSIRYRLWLGFISVFIYLLYKIYCGELVPLLRLTPTVTINLSYYSYTLLTCLVVVGIVNSFNITDGVDGLLSSLTAQIIMVSFLLFGRFGINYPYISTLMSIFLGCVLSYFVFNFPPAKLFMGNVGSLTIGSIIAVIYTLYNMHLFLIIICGMLVVNTISDIIQSFSYRVFGKRVFPIAPLHHTLEFKGLNSLQIDLIYFILNLAINAILFLILR